MRDKKPIVIAHRGVSGHYPENTMSAFIASEKVGADMIELDVTLTKDKVPVVIHDDTLNRTSNGNGTVRSTLYEDIRRLDAGSWFGERFAGEKIPRLEEVLEFIQGSPLRVNIEIKSTAYDQELSPAGIESQVLKYIYGYGIEEKCIISSFHPAILERIRAKDSDIRLSYLRENLQNWESIYRLSKELQVYSLNISQEEIPCDLFHSIHKEFKVFAYTINQKDSMIRMIQEKVDAIFTDYPEEFLQVYNAYNE
jgi:glycerophosphoryl diester phosphodiesterase